MPNALILNEYIFQVTQQCREDGHRFPVAHFTSLADAEEYMRSSTTLLNPDVRQVGLWRSDDGRWFHLQYDEVAVDEWSIRNRALSKLSLEERRVLGVK